jgi:hypothetical protein
MTLKYSPAATSRASERLGCTIDGVSVKGIAPGPMVAILSDARQTGTVVLVPTKLDADGFPDLLVPITVTSSSTVT